jgi:hypothetical protein
MSESEKSHPQKNRHQEHSLPLDGAQFPNESFPLENNRIDESTKIDVTPRARVVPIPPKPQKSQNIKVRQHLSAPVN